MDTLIEEQATNETPMNSGEDRKIWTAEERIALRILGRLGYEGDLLRPLKGLDKGEYIALMFDIIVEELNNGVIELGESERPLDQLVSAAATHFIDQRKANRGAK